MIEKVRNNKWSFYFGTLIVLLAIFAVTDLSISKAIYNPKSLWGNFFNIFGEHPSSILAFVGASILFRVRDTKSIIKNIFIGFITIVFAVFNGLTMWLIADSRLFHHEKIEGSMPIYALVFSIILTIIVQIILYRIPKERILKYKRAALISVFIVLISMISVNIIKVFWGRVRFRDMIGDFSQFTPWYLPQGNTGNKSFPSGHSANSWTILAITLYIAKENIKAYRNSIILAISWGTIVATSRIVMGAHFASDVTVGAAITIATFFILKSVIKDTAIQGKIKIEDSAKETINN